MADSPRVALLTIPFTGFDRGLIEGISRYAQLHGPWVFYLTGDPQEVPVPVPVPDSHSGVFRGNFGGGRVSGEPDLPDFRRWKVTGIIGRIQSAKIARRILASGLPTIAIDLSREQLAANNPLAALSEIRAGSHPAGCMAAEHFLERGFRHFAFCGYAGRIWSELRLEGFASRLRLAGYSCHVYEPQAHANQGVTWAEEQPLVASWLESLPKPVAIMACNDIRGRQVLEASLLRHLSVPEDVAVIGVDNDTLICNLTNPPLSSVVFNLEQAGYAAAEHLDGLMSGGIRQARRIDIEPLWVAGRRSTDVIATDDRHVSAALRFIRDHARQAIGVEDVAQQAEISRRTLEIRFRRRLGRSVRDEIERCRVTYAKQLLLETSLSVERIAHLAGFGSLAYFSKVFHRRVGSTALAFRQRRMP
jgi:LacI family transcriptional regulator